jgi:hypothetical protein
MLAGLLWVAAFLALCGVGYLVGVGLGRLELPAEEIEDEGDPGQEAEQGPPGDS